MRYEEYVKKTVEKIATSDELNVTDLPTIDLYMDQITTFMDEKLELYKRNEDDKVLTKTMINNYVKSNIIPKPNNKKYSKDQMLLLMLVYHMKRVLSVKDLEQLMVPIMENYTADYEDKIKLDDLYNIWTSFLNDEKEKLEESINGDVVNVKEMLKDAEIQDDDILEIFMLIVVMTMRANVQKLIAEKLLDEYFGKPKEDEKKKKKK